MDSNSHHQGSTPTSVGISGHHQNDVDSSSNCSNVITQGATQANTNQSQAVTSTNTNAESIDSADIQPSDGQSDGHSRSVPLGHAPPWR